jgi:hypothetical protein
MSQWLVSNYLGATVRKRKKKGAATRNDEIAMI